MDGDFDPASWGDSIADIYDDLFSRHAPRGAETTERSVERLAELAGEGPILELGVGTGRVAIPLVERGFTVNAIEVSRGMVEALRAKPGGDRIAVTLGDFARTETGERHSLVFAIFNAILSAGSQDDQIRCFEQAAKQLKPEGLFVVEAAAKPPPAGNSISVQYVGEQGVILCFTHYDPETQRLRAWQTWIRENGIRSALTRGRLASPSELDLMARLGGFRLEARWAGWNREPFAEPSANHVSIYALR
jgi:SAM-dependent methyltransferase